MYILLCGVGQVDCGTLCNLWRQNSLSLRVFIVAHVRRLSRQICTGRFPEAIKYYALFIGKYFRDSI